MEKCSHVRIRLENLKQHTVKRYIVPIITNTVVTSTGQLTKTYQIEFNKKRMLFNAEKKTFAQIPFPIHDTIEQYQNATGLENEQAEKTAALIWGANKIEVPIHKFFDIYKEHLVAPFFVF